MVCLVRMVPQGNVARQVLRAQVVVLASLESQVDMVRLAVLASTAKTVRTVKMDFKAQGAHLERRANKAIPAMRSRVSCKSI